MSPKETTLVPFLNPVSFICMGCLPMFLKAAIWYLILAKIILFACTTWEDMAGIRAKESLMGSNNLTIYVRVGLLQIT